jgi:hypothetical protein
MLETLGSSPALVGGEEGERNTTFRKERQK